MWGSLGTASSECDAKCVRCSQTEGWLTKRAVGNSRLSVHVIFVMFFFFPHFSVINRQKVRLIALPTSQGERAKLVPHFLMSDNIC